MESPICLSQNFVNKLNVRSFGNVLKPNILKNEDNIPFFLHMFENSIPVSEVTSEIIHILITLKINLRDKSKEDFVNYFCDIAKEQDFLRPVNKEDIFNRCWTALNEIIPKSFFGGNRNFRIFKKLVRTVIYSMKRQHSMLAKITKSWDFTAAPWRSLEDKSKLVLNKMLIWIIKHVLSAMICLNFYVTTCKVDADENKLHFFWKNHWQSFYDKKISKMLTSKVIKRFEPYCVGKKVKRKYNLIERLKLKSLKKDIPKLHLVLKPNNDCRPIVRYKNDQRTSAEKYKIKEKLTFLKTLIGKPHTKIELQFNIMYQNWLDFKCPKLYFIKTDLSNAFGVINKEKLMKIMCEKHLKFQKEEKCLHSKKKFAQQYKEMVLELRKPLLVRAGNTVYEWTEGLVQGYKYSPALSELYYSYLDEIYLSEHMKNLGNQVRLFTRVVDDYLYITDSLKDAHLFLQALTNYRNLNYDKTVINFSYEGIRFSNEITFLGYSYNTDLLQVSRARNVFIGHMCYKIAFSTSIINLPKFIENRIGQSGIQINGHMFNLYYNTEEVLWQHVFTTFCLSANKFCTILAICELSSKMSKIEIVNYILLYKKKVSVKLSNSIIGMLMKNKPKDFLFMYCINHFRYLSYKALYLCAKQTAKCNVLVPFINNELAKSNCIFGKWRDHACRIEANGEVRQQAVREVCRRSDLRLVMKGFDNLPRGFQCYNEQF